MKDGKGMNMPSKKMEADEPVGRVVELFAGVGGFRLGLEGIPEDHRQLVHPSTGVRPEPSGKWKVVWGNQWEPPGTPSRQFAWKCYARRFGVSDEEHRYGNSDIESALNSAEAGDFDLPDHELLVGGFPCQDYSVAKPLNQAHGIEGRKGVLWWQIHRLIEKKRPLFILLENVDRLLKSPASQRGRDFAIILATLSDLGYLVEWRVINAADHGFPQRRRRAFIIARLDERIRSDFDPHDWIVRDGVFARAFPVESAVARHATFKLMGDAYEVSESFGRGLKTSPFENAGVMRSREVRTCKVEAISCASTTLGDVVLQDEWVPEQYFLEDDRVDSWAYLKGAKKEKRIHKGSGTEYMYSEGGMVFPDPLERPSRTVLTGEGGTGPSRFKHVISGDSGRLRRLTPVELERLNGFPDDWTADMSDNQRAFCMGNALVVGVVQRLGDVLAEELAAQRD